MNPLSTDTIPPLLLAPQFSLHPLSKGVFLLLSEERSIKLNDPLYALIFPLLDGRRNREQILNALTTPGSEEETACSDFLDSMIAKGYIVGMEPRTDTAHLAWLLALGLSPTESLDVLSSFSLSILPLGQEGAAGHAACADLAALIVSEGMTLTRPEDATLCLVVVEDYRQAALFDWAEDARKTRRTWIPFKPGGTRPLLGPIIAPHREGGACYTCLARRIVEHRPGDQVVIASSGPRPARGWTKASLSLAQALVARELADYALGRRPDIESHLIAWSSENGCRECHPLPLFPDCPACGKPPGEARAEPVVLKDSPISDHTDGGWHALSPDEALKRLDAIVSPLTGIVSHLRLTSPAEGLYVYSASQGASASADPRLNRRLGRPEGASGKGLTDIEARIGCLAEAVERYACQWTGGEARRVARWGDLGDTAPHPHRLLQFSDYQYAHRESLNPSQGDMGKIPEPFREEALIDWSPAWSLTHDEERWLPSRYTYFGYQTVDLPDDHAFCHADSNGCASGGSLEEAILQGFLELVERDAISLWWYPRIARRALAMEGIDDAFVARMKAHYTAIGRDFHLLDLTTDLAIPVMGAISKTHDGKRIIMGFGAHFDARMAALRALTELNQILLLDADTARMAPLSDPCFQQWFDEESIESHPWLMPDEAPPLSLTAFAKPAFSSLAEAIRHSVSLLSDRYDFIVQPLHRPGLPLSCARVVVPGLCHFWNRRGAARLYDIPVRQGWQKRALEESELNPIPFFL